MSKRRILTILLVIVAIGIGAFFYKRYHVPPVVNIRAIALTDLNGQNITLRFYAGHPLFVSFFATWCGPCIREMPDLVVLEEKLSDKELTVVCISDEPIGKLKQLDERFKGKLTFLHAENSLHDIGIYTYPTNYIYTATGKKVYNKANPDRWTDPALIEQIRTSLD